MAYFNTTLDDLPALDTDSRQHAERMLTYLAEMIASHDGFIGFDQYMHAALYAPGLGYYSAGSEKFGPAGDYVTAPLMTPLFSQALAHFMAASMQSGDAILELGAGSGMMAADMLAYLETVAALPSDYRILEPSADLQQRQAATLRVSAPVYSNNISWLDSLPGDGAFNGVIVGNEVVDAMPVKRFVLQAGQILELGVGLDDGRLCWKTSTADDGFRQAVLSRLPYPLADYHDGYCSEYRPAVDGWVKMLSEYMRSGMVVLLDYGHERSSYYDTSRLNGTLRGYYRHYMLEDPFTFPGMVDLTASVDFTEIAESAVQHGFQVAGYTSQANFLIDNGLLDLAQQMLDADSQQDTMGRLSQAEAIKCLTDPGEMGESVKVLVLTRSRDIETGFVRDQRYRL